MRESFTGEILGGEAATLEHVFDSSEGGLGHVPVPLQARPPTYQPQAGLG
ncbi:hypothetical protein HMPREF0058_0371 [Actinomyces urogenitalis DSM 15434]|uniref:Uncharacterized protein n=1 Tax=Actinomyces urogenitalis DSM 15434 TaxID=525246 RepID=C0W3C7_9ACTO|nr:hypothetical protein HMPREF0058_0371 [Actinomyces urogenitalis DSM 15434]